MKRLTPMSSIAKSILTSALVLASVLVARPAFAEDPAGIDALRYLPVQDAGRIKPYDTFARESLQLIYGSQSYKTPKGEKREALEIVTTWMLVPQHWDNQKLVEISHRGLKEALKVKVEEKFFTPNELFANDRLGLIMQELAAFRESKKKMDPYIQAAQRLESQLGMYQAIKQGSAIRVVPPKPGEGMPETQPPTAGTMNGMAGMAPVVTERWYSLADLPEEFRGKFAALTRAFIQSLPTEGAAPGMAIQKDPTVPSLKLAVEDFKSAARANNPSLYPSERDISIEVHYKALHPFLITWILYLVAAIMIGIAWHTGGSLLYKGGWVVAILAFLVHTYGFGLRVYLTGRPPVSNMYESVIWVSWGTLVFAFILEALSRRRFVLMAGAVVGTLCLIIADMAPAILDRSLQPLQPVLRSNYWLTVHVLTITLSYSAFFLAWGLANMGLYYLLRGEKPTAERPRLMVQAIYRCIQVGVVLLAAGIILGGIWADYSWGRFWGWDPKETWALIALLGYLAILHGRLIGWVQNFGMMASSIVSFNLVIMAWYGVNYVLGAGLHSYGFGAGGIQYVSAFVILNLIYVGYVAFVRHSNERMARVAVSGAKASAE